jgi:hypothetical protein
MNPGRERRSPERAVTFRKETLVNTRLILVACAPFLIGPNAVVAADHVQRSQDRFVGHWTHENPETRGLTKIVIRKDDNDWLIRAWGACEPEDCDWGETKLSLLGDSADAQDLPYAFATWDHGFANTHIVLRIKAATLVAETYDIFKDNSERSNYRSVDRLKRSYSLQK